MKFSKIPTATITRLSIYSRYLEALSQEGVKIIETAGNNPEPYIGLLKASRAWLLHKAARVRDLKTAERLGYDAVSVAPQFVPEIKYAVRKVSLAQAQDLARAAVDARSSAEVKAVVARSFERIHRSNLVGMGVLPLQFVGSDSVTTLKIIGDETFALSLIPTGVIYRKERPIFEEYIGVSGQQPLVNQKMDPTQLESLLDEFA